MVRRIRGVHTRGLGDGTTSTADRDTFNAWNAAQVAAGLRVVPSIPTGDYQGQYGTALAQQDMADYPDDNGWNYQPAPDNIQAIYDEENGISFTDELASGAMAYSGTVLDATQAAADALKTAAQNTAGFAFSLFPWYVWAGLGVTVLGVGYVALRDPEKTRRYAKKFTVPV